MKKKKTRRSTTENSAVIPQLNLKSRYEELEDINEYYKDLPPEAQQWMNSYTENFINASFTKEDQNLINFNFTKSLLKKYIKDIKSNKTKDKKVVSFVNKYLIRSDNIPLKIIKELFFEEDERKQVKLVKRLRNALLNNIKKTKKREINKIIKIIQREVYGVNNSRNRCILTKEKAGGTLNYLEELTDNDQMLSNEDQLIEVIDLRNQIEKLKNTSDNSDDSSDNS